MASRLDHHNHKAASRMQGTHKRLDRERLSANPSSQADCPANPLMVRKSDSSQLIWSVWSIWFVWFVWLSGFLSVQSAIS